MRGKGVQQQIHGLMLLQVTYKGTCGGLYSKGRNVKVQGDVVHKQGSNARVLYKVCLMLLLQASSNYNEPPKTYTLLCPLPLHEHRNTCVNSILI